jgi:hypothetical protein
MTSANATGYYETGEVEDYRVLVDNFPLATNLLSFDASLQNIDVSLTWTCDEEIGLNGYDIERTKDYVNWTKIGFVNASGANGTFTYQFTDANALKGESYYRLKLVEANGKSHSSAVKKITIKEFDADVTIAPNPADKFTTANIQMSQAGEVTLSVVTTDGSVILSKKQRVEAGKNEIHLKLPETMSPGMYYIRILSGKEISNKKLIKK